MPKYSREAQSCQKTLTAKNAKISRRGRKERLSGFFSAPSAISAVKSFPMRLLILGRGKTGTLVAEVAAERKHHLVIAGAKENASSAALTPEKLRDVDTVIDFTAPHCVIANIEACVKSGKNMVVGTTGWHKHQDHVRNLVEQRGTGFLYSSNFSIGVNLFFDVARAAAAALRHDYTGQIFERHHAHKKDAPSGTAIALQRLIRESSGKPEDLEIISFRE